MDVGKLHTDAKCGTVPAEIAGNDRYFSMCSYKGRDGKAIDDDLRVHSGYWILLLGFAGDANKVMNSGGMENK